MQVTNPGPDAYLPTIGLEDPTVKKGETVDVPDAVGEQLVAQGWKPAKKHTHKTAAPAEPQED